jgi:uncharacterized protein YbbK (DUF523 family)
MRKAKLPCRQKMHPHKLLVSACLLGSPVRYNGQAKTLHHALLEEWLREGRVVPVCPELAGGLGVPRPAAEIEPGASGRSVLLRQARVLTATGDDLTDAFATGAAQALVLAKQHGIRLAVLKEGSPSCGTSVIYDGSFGGTKQAGEGVTAAALRQAGVAVFSECELELAAEYLAGLG